MIVRKKNDGINCMRLEQDNVVECMKFITKYNGFAPVDGAVANRRAMEQGGILVRNSKGVTLALYGYYIIEIDKEFYVYDPYEFEELFEVVEWKV